MSATLKIEFPTGHAISIGFNCPDDERFRAMSEQMSNEIREDFERMVLSGMNADEAVMIIGEKIIITARQSAELFGSNP